MALLISKLSYCMIWLLCGQFVSPNINVDPGLSTPKKVLNLQESATWLLEIASLP